MVRSRSGRRPLRLLVPVALLLVSAGFAQPASPPAAGADHAAHFFLVIAAVLVAAKLLGELAERLGQPAVLGELMAGVLLGPYALGVLPAGGDLHATLGLLAEIGVAILLFEIGLETDLKEMFRVGGSATVVALVGVALPFLLGFLFWVLVAPRIGAPAAGISLTAVAVFVGATLTATSVGITARVLTDLGRIHTPEARIVIGAAVVDDVLGLVILALVSSLAAGVAITVFGVALKFVLAAGFLVAAVVLGSRLAPALFSVIERMRVRGVLLVMAFAFALLFAGLAHYAGSAMIIGSFAAGIVLSTTNQFDLITDRVASVSDVFTPFFFVHVGAGVNTALLNPWSASFDVSVLGLGLALLLIAVLGKVASGYTVGWGRRPLNQLAIGIGMVPRGEVGLIFAHLGLSRGILTSGAYSAILIMVIFTTFLAPPLLKRAFARTADVAPPPAPPDADPAPSPVLHS